MGPQRMSPRNTNAAETSPQVNMIRDIQIRAPTLFSARLLGTSSIKYPMKKMPAPKP